MYGGLGVSGGRVRVGGAGRLPPAHLGRFCINEGLELFIICLKLSRLLVHLYNAIDTGNRFWLLVNKMIDPCLSSHKR